MRGWVAERSPTSTVRSAGRERETERELGGEEILGAGRRKGSTPVIPSVPGAKPRTRMTGS